MKAPSLGRLQFLLCRLGWHRRDGRNARKIGTYLESRCSGCGLPMSRIRGRWTLDAAASRDMVDLTGPPAGEAAAKPRRTSSRPATPPER